MDTNVPRYSKRGQSLQERLLANSVLREGGCREWLKSKNKAGYGTMKWRGECVLAHRKSYEAFVGKIPDGLDVLHSCDNRGCIEPIHLFPGTNDDNVADRVAKGRSGAARGSDHPGAKLTEKDVAEIRTSKDSYRVLAKRLGVRVGNIWNVRRRKTWKHV